MEEVRKATCQICGKKSFLVSSFLGVCGECIEERFSAALPWIVKAHERIRREFGISYRGESAHPACHLCVRHCGEGESFCGLLREGRRWAGTFARGLLEWYYDNLPTNCVASFVCPEREHRGYQNLAVFYGGCNFNCLFCQNWHHRYLVQRAQPLVSVEELERALHPRVACVCFFGGDPIPQLAHALAFSRRVKDRVRICFETNGAVHPRLLHEMFSLCVESGGILKFDLKAWSDKLHRALTGVSNELVLGNFAWAMEKAKEYSQVVVVASTLLVPGYVTVREVRNLAHFIVRRNPAIPYALLAFAPNFYLDNLPATSVSHAEEALHACEEAGLTSLSLGNRFLLSYSY